MTIFTRDANGMMRDAPDSQRTLDRLNVRIGGAGHRTMVFAHGYGCDQNMWRLVAPAFESQFRTVLFDYIGAGGSDISAYDADKYGSLEGYADDVIDLAGALGITDGVFVGHSVSAMIGLIVARRAPHLFSTLVLVGPSPCYIDCGDYVGGFSREQIDELLEFLDSNHLGWSQAMAPVIMGNSDRPELGDELTASFCRTDPDIAKRFGRVTFLTDSRAELGAVDARVLVLQCREDIIAPPCVGDFVQRAIPGSSLVTLDATGHCPNLSAPEATIAAIEAFV
ncbi:alpha/beta hydrolase [uncultured Sphingomonas sp.]|uniref:alpha/beta fold hydrolase n=2 Tax=Sphingomonadaceae TaxID=41297 RepID=UPI000AAA6668|nr:alpha/beta hydrolase [uncultured Sphingomonas sp.]